METVYDPERDGQIEAEGDLSVLHALIEAAQVAQKEGIKSNHIPEEKRVVAFILPGAMAGVYGGGQVTAIHEAGLTDGLTAVIGVSTGAPTAAYLLAGDPRLGTRIYSEECTTPDFIRPKRILDGYGMDVKYLSQLYRGKEGEKPLNVENIKESKPAFLVAVTEYDTGKGELLDGKDVPTIDALEASAAAPILFRDEVFINGTRYVDGGIGMPFPVREIIERYHPTHILVLPNCPKQYRRSSAQRVLENTLSIGLPTPLRNALLARYDSFDTSLKLLRNSRIPHLILWTDNAVTSFTRDPEKLKAAAARSEEHLRELITLQRP